MKIAISELPGAQLRVQFGEEFVVELPPADAYAVGQRLMDKSRYLVSCDGADPRRTEPMVFGS